MARKPVLLCRPHLIKSTLLDLISANLASIIANLKLKRGLDCVPDEKLQTLTETSRYISEVANVIPNDHAAYVGHAAFAHKAGVHVSAVTRKPDS